jgi:hypothetical protein
MWPFNRIAQPRLSLRLHRSVRTPFLLSYLCAATASFIAVGFYLQLPPVIPLFYTLAEAADQLVAREWVFLFPALGITISIAHTLIVQTFQEHGRVVSRLFSWATVVVQLLLMLSIIRIVLIIT